MSSDPAGGGGAQAHLLAPASWLHRCRGALNAMLVCLALAAQVRWSGRWGIKKFAFTYYIEFHVDLAAVPHP